MRTFLNSLKAVAKFFKGTGRRDSNSETFISNFLALISLHKSSSGSYSDNTFTMRPFIGIIVTPIITQPALFHSSNILFVTPNNNSGGGIK